MRDLPATMPNIDSGLYLTGSVIFDTSSARSMQSSFLRGVTQSLTHSIVPQRSCIRSLAETAIVSNICGLLEETNSFPGCNIRGSPNEWQTEQYSTRSTPVAQGNIVRCSFNFDLGDTDRQ